MTTTTKYEVFSAMDRDSNGKAITFGRTRATLAEARKDAARMSKKATGVVVVERLSAETGEILGTVE